MASASVRRSATVFTGVTFNKRRSAASCVRSTSPSAIAASALRAASSIRPADSFTATLAALECRSAFESLLPAGLAKHDLADQLTSAVLTDTGSTPAILTRQAWAYDAAGNRTVDQADDAVFSTTHDALNRMGARAPGGPIVFAKAP